MPCGSAAHRIFFPINSQVLTTHCLWLATYLLRAQPMKLLPHLAAVLVLAGTTQAAVYTIETSLNPLQAGTDNQGWYANNTGNNNATNDNYFTGFSGGFELRSWFAFDLSSVAGTITDITFEVKRYGQSANLTLGLFDVTTPASQLTSGRDGTIYPAIFNDLGTGTSYGNFSVSNGSSLDVLSFALNPAAIADANAASGYFALGAAVIGTTGFIFSGSNGEPGNGGEGFTQRLVITTESAAVPETSATIGLLLCAMASLAAIRRTISRT